MTNELYFTGGKNKLLKAIAKDSLPIIITGKPESGRTTLAQELLSLSHREDVYDDCVDLNKMLGFALNTKQGIEFTIFVSEPEHVKEPIGDYYLVQCFRVYNNFTFRVQAITTNSVYPSKTTVHITAEDKVVSVEGDISLKDLDLKIDSHEGEVDVINITSDKDVKILNNVLSSINYMNEITNYDYQVRGPIVPKIVYTIDYSKDVTANINRVELQKYIKRSKVYHIGFVLLNAPEGLSESIKIIKEEGENKDELK